MADLYNQLRELRRKLAEQEGLEIFMVFNNATLDALCIARPQDSEALLQIKGMGEKKVAKWGREILRIVASDKLQVTSGDGVEVGLVEQSLQGGDTIEMSNDKFLISNEKTEERDQEQKQKVSVSQYVDYLNLVLQKTADVQVVGEVSGSKMYPSGFYFTLKDKMDESALSCYLPTYTYRGLGMPLEDGMEVAVEGLPKLVKRNGRFQFVVENLELVGEGALKKAYDLLKAKFDAEGLFARKRELPEFVQSVGVITSRAGAVIHDFRNNLAKFGIRVYLKDVQVEGASSPGMVVDALQWFNNAGNKMDSGQSLVETGMAKPVDVIVVMRGGGSLEDLQGFNNEQVVRAVFGSKIPTIVSIGHDKDVPLAQLAADVMVSTPTAAAHVVSATWNRLVEDLPRLQVDLLFRYVQSAASARQRYIFATQILDSWCSRLSQSYSRLQGLLLLGVMRLQTWATEQRVAVHRAGTQIMQSQLQQYKLVSAQVATFTAFLEQANPERQLKLGYSIVKNKRGGVVRSVRDVQTGDELHTQVADGSIISVIK